MKKLICALVCAAVALSMMLSSCTGTYEKSPAEFNKITWIAPDYSLRFTPDDDCKGKYTFDGESYEIRLVFDSTRVTAYDAADEEKIFFYADWKYEDGDYLYLYNIDFNTDEYEPLADNFVEFLRLHQQKIK